MDNPGADVELFFPSRFGFTDEDLDANRQGSLTKKQLAFLSNKRALWICFILIPIGSCPLLSAWTIFEGIERQDSISSRIGIIVLIWLACAYVLRYSWLRWRRYSQDVYEREVHISEGVVKLDITEIGRGNIVYVVNVNDMSLKVAKELFLSFKNGDPYCIYYTPHSKTILSAEWLRE